jgi:hypothetical protein
MNGKLGCFAHSVKPAKIRVVVRFAVFGARSIAPQVAKHWFVRSDAPRSGQTNPPPKPFPKILQSQSWPNRFGMQYFSGVAQRQ